MSPSATGTVIAVQANFYQVQLLDGQQLLCTKREKLKKIGTKVMVGDVVMVDDWQSERGVITTVAARSSELDRPPIANVDCIMLVFALAEPAIDPLLLSKFLVKAESTDIPVTLCLNKCDLLPVAEQEQWIARLTGWGYPPILISTLTGAGMSVLQEQLRDRTTVVAGNSGVGKSSLINQLIPDLGLRVAAVSGKLNRGRHTTRHVELFNLPTGGLIADTPGFNQPDLTCYPIDLPTYFPEIRSQLPSHCQFNDCWHQGEPGCVIDREWERYPHYLEFLAEAIAYQHLMANQKQPDAQWKQKTNKLEPLLAAKRYRRVSRRSQTQGLPNLTEDASEDS
jgi:ribosome biogenesis GTPase / thiamine phosphate phosphatase